MSRPFARLAPRAYNFGRRVLPRPARSLIKRLLRGNGLAGMAVDEALWHPDLSLWETMPVDPHEGRYDVLCFAAPGVVCGAGEPCAGFTAIGHRVRHLRAPAGGDEQTEAAAYRGLEAAALGLAEPTRLGDVDLEDLREVVCLTRSPAWTRVLRTLRDRFGWTVVYLPSGGPDGRGQGRVPRDAEADLASLCDLVVAPTAAVFDRVAPLTVRCILLPDAGRPHVLRDAIARAVPRATIVITTHGNVRMTLGCLQSVWAHSLYPNVEVMVVDNGSDDGTGEVLARLRELRPELRVILNRENRGFPAATNQGIAATAGEIVVLLNNDTVVTRGWLGTLIRHLRSDPRIGMIGPVTNAAGNEAAVPVGYTSPAEMHSFAAGHARRHAGETRDLPMLGMFCVALPRRVLQRVGLLDERFGLGMFEDDDYSMRVRALGYRLVCAEDVFVHHFGRSTIKALDDRRYDTLFEQNREQFQRKWQTTWSAHRMRGET